MEHCGTYFIDRAYYCARIATFFRQAFERPALEAKSAVPDVAKQMELILDVQTTDWWTETSRDCTATTAVIPLQPRPH